MKHVSIEPGHDVHWEEIHGIHQQYPDKYGQRCRRNKLVAIAVEYSLHLVVDKLHCNFNKRLSFPGYTGSRATHNPPKKAEAHDSEQNRHDQRINVQHPEIALS